MRTFGERLDELIEALGMKKIDFADRIGVSSAYVSQLCSGVRMPSDRTISDICREFSVNESWLRDEEGNRFREIEKSGELSAMLANLMKDQPDFRHRLLTVLLRSTPEEWDVIERKARELVEEMQKADPQ